MSLTPPSVEGTRDRLEALGFDVDEDDVETFHALVAETLETFDRTAELDEPDDYHPDDTADRAVESVDSDADRLNAWVRRCHIAGAEDGVLADRTVAVKDNVSVAGVPMTCGSTFMDGHVPDIDATVVTRILDAGGTITGVTNMDAFAFSGVGDVSDYGPVFNPHDESRYAGGSSAGSAAAVADGDVDVAVGGDQGGSVRIPAAWSGCVGLKPTKGLVPYTGIVRVDNTIDNIGPLARSAEDAARWLEAVAGEDPMDPRQPSVDPDAYVDALDGTVGDLTVGRLSEGFGLEPSEPVVDETVDAALEEFTDVGATVTSVSVPEHADAMPVWLPIIVEGAAATLAQNGAGYGWEGYHDTTLAATLSAAWDSAADELPFNVKVAALVADYLSDAHDGGFYSKAQNLRRSFRAAYEAAFEDVDLLALPTTPMRAFEHDPDVSDADRFRHALLPALNTCAFNATGHPAVSVPCGKPDGLPVGLMLVGPHFADATVLRAADAFERATDWTNHTAN